MREAISISLVREGEDLFEVRSGSRDYLTEALRAMLVKIAQNVRFDAKRGEYVARFRPAEL